MKKNLLILILGIVLFIPTIKASNDNPKVVSEIVKDGSLDFNVTLTDMDINSNTNYRWAIVRTQAADPCNMCWYYPEEWTSNSMNIHLDFSKSDIRNILNYVDDAYLIIKEENTDTIISDHIKINVSIPYAYGLTPYKNESNQWTVKLAGTLSSIYTSVYIEAVEIKNEDIINEYLKLKKEGITDEKLKEFIKNLNLTENDIPKEWQSSLRQSEAYNITNDSLYFVWSKASEYQASGGKNIYGVTIYDNGYKEINKENEEQTINEIKEESKTEKPNQESIKQTSNTTENPKTGVNTSILISSIIIAISTITYIIIRKKNKFKNI